MTQAQLNAALAAILTMLAEVGSAPSGVVYAALMSLDAELYTHTRYTRLVALLVGGGLVTKSGLHVLELTAEGREMARQIEEAVTAAQAEVNG